MTQTLQHTTPKKQPITILPSASKRIKQLLAQRGSKSFGIRVGVKSGGCSGLTYTIEYADESRPFEEIISQDDIKVLVDPKAIMYLIGTEMDFVEEKFKSGFIFKNPNEKGRCGCGESFSV
ncbi:MAG: iron-sulfur cluster assembly accessory protein [Rickettsiaceae bacterium]|nr:iron-sulfur cluster assembly accessory protein [Rickettsiaceae bacterium]